MKRNLILILTIFLISVIPAVLASDTSIGVTIDITTEDFAPLIWQCDNRVVLEDCVEAGRLSDCPQTLVERVENYAFEGEQIGFDVLVMDKNKIEEIQEVAITIGSSQSNGGGTGTITQTGDVTFCDDIPLTNTDWDNNLVLNKFDDSLGDLVSAEIQLNTEIINSINIENQ